MSYIKKVREFVNFLPVIKKKRKAKYFARKKFVLDFDPEEGGKYLCKKVRVVLFTCKLFGLLFFFLITNKNPETVFLTIISF